MFVIHMVPIWQFSYRNVLRYFEENVPKVFQSNIPKLRQKGVASTQAPMRGKADQWSPLPPLSHDPKAITVSPSMAMRKRINPVTPVYAADHPGTAVRSSWT